MKIHRYKRKNDDRLVDIVEHESSIDTGSMDGSGSMRGLSDFRLRDGSPLSRTDDGGFSDGTFEYEPAE